MLGPVTTAPRIPALQPLLRRAAGFPETGIRLLDRDEKERFLGWAEVDRRAAGIAGALRECGIEPGDRVALLFPTGEEFLAAFFGALYARAVPVPLYPPVRLGRLAEYHERTAAMIRAVEAPIVLAHPRVRAILGETALRALPPLGVRTLDELPAAPPLRETGEPEELGLIQFSSGTTVEPKPVALSHRALLAQVALLDELWPDSAELRHSGVSWLPLYHDMGLIGCVLPALSRPAVLTLIPPEAFVARPAIWLRAISRYRATVSPAPNFAYALAADRIRDDEIAGIDLASWRTALSGAETVIPDVLRRFAARFARFGFRAEAFAPVYGLSEAALAVTFPPLGRLFRSTRFDRDALALEGRAAPAALGREIVSVGGPLPGFALEIRDERGRPLPAGRVGRIWARGPSLMTGYFGNPAATAAVLADGWLDTGDLGFLVDGELYVTGRAKDLILLRGRKYAPDEVEQAVSGVDGVRTGCVAAVSHLPESRESEEVLLFVEHRKSLPRQERDGLADRCREAALAAAGFAIDRVVLLAPGTLPRTSSGKIRRQEALRRHLDGGLAAPARVDALRLAAKLVGSRVALARARRDTRASSRPRERS